MRMEIKMGKSPVNKEGLLAYTTLEEYSPKQN